MTEPIILYQVRTSSIMSKYKKQTNINTWSGRVVPLKTNKIRIIKEHTWTRMAQLVVINIRQV